MRFVLLVLFMLFVVQNFLVKKRSLKLSWWPHLHYYFHGLAINLYFLNQTLKLCFSAPNLYFLILLWASGSQFVFWNWGPLHIYFELFADSLILDFAIFEFIFLVDFFFSFETRLMIVAVVFRLLLLNKSPKALFKLLYP